MRGTTLDVGRRCVGGLDLLERARERERVAGELRTHRIGQVLPLPADAERQNLGDQRSEEPRDDPQHEQDEDERPELAAPGARAALLGEVATARPSAASVVMRRTSKFFTWPSSWPTTAWSSSRLHSSSSPRVTARWECSGSVPV